MTTPADAALHELGDRFTTDEPCYELTLFVSGASDLAARAVTNARRVCDAHLAGRYRLAVVDVYEDVTAFISNDVLATPTLMRNLPLPVLIVMAGLFLRALGAATEVKPGFEVANRKNS
jgi:hypothetical protein